MHFPYKYVDLEAASMTLLRYKYPVFRPRLMQDEQTVLMEAGTHA